MAPTWAQFLARDPDGDDRLHGDRDRLEPRRGGARPGAERPDAYRLVAVAVFAIYFTLPLIALSALPVEDDRTASYRRCSALPPEEGGFQNDPVLGLVENLGLAGTALDASQIYVGVLAATILFIATNAGVIGASRITYAMASYRQLPGVFRRLHPRFRTPWLALVVFAGIVADPDAPARARSTFLGTMYSFGAMLSFTIAHVALDRACAYARRDEELALPGAAEPPHPRDRLAALRARRRARRRASPGSSSSCRSRRRAGRGSAGSRSGFVGYAVYRRRFVQRAAAGDGARAGARARAVADDRVPDDRRPGRPLGRVARRRSSPPRGSRPSAARRVAIVHVIEVPLDLPLDATLPERGGGGRRAARRRARRSSSATACRAVTRLVRARAAGPRDRRGGGAPQRRAGRPRRAAQAAVGGGEQAVFGAHRRLRAEGEPVRGSWSSPGRRAA